MSGSSEFARTQRHMLPKALIAGLLVVSLLTQGLPISVCRCALAAAEKRDAANEAAAEPACPHCVGKVRQGEPEFAAPCCGESSACGCCLEKSRTRTVVTTSDISVPERPAPQALPPTDPLADLSGVAIDGVALGAIPDVPPRLPVRILLCVWRK
ncbi:MAG TPA: hypothetical protein VGN57_11095 [Pirellulaceae bacterium]|jgi:hypothetical protein|nr:hypothetical protein [Pirellulaceae bacterium]